METLEIAIRQNPGKKGISIGKEETKILQYVDDTTAVLSDTNSAKILFDLLNRFESISGLKINYTKTEGMWIGSSKNNNEKPFGIKWSDEPVKALEFTLLMINTCLRKEALLKDWIALKNL